MSQTTLILVVLALGLAQCSTVEFAGTWKVKTFIPLCGLKGDKITITKTGDTLRLQFAFADVDTCGPLRNIALEGTGSVPTSGNIAIFRPTGSTDEGERVLFTVVDDYGVLAGPEFGALEFERANGISFFLIIVILLIIVAVGGGVAFVVNKKKGEELSRTLGSNSNNFLQA